MSTDIEKVREFYDDCKNILMKRIDNYDNKIEKNGEEENKIIKKIKDIQNELEQIKNNKGNHINNEERYSLKINSYKEADKLEKDILYLNEELNYLRKIHAEENKSINDEIRKNIEKYSQFDEEKNIFIQFISLGNILDINKASAIIKRIREETEKQNNIIFKKYKQ